VDREIVIRSLRELFDEERGDIVCAYLFGSVARGEQTASSDVDVDPSRTFLGALGDLRERELRVIHVP
jgi:predicted nucleotidyltransferase